MGSSSRNMSMSQDKSNRPDQGRKYRPAGLLCSSCDQCRAKKIKCDGKKPCEACKKSYARKNNIVRIDGANLRAEGLSVSTRKRDQGQRLIRLLTF